MTQFTPPGKQIGFADLRQQIAEMVCNTASPADEMGQLPSKKLQVAPRETLHLHHPKQKPHTP